MNREPGKRWWNIPTRIVVCVLCAGLLSPSNAVSGSKKKQKESKKAQQIQLLQQLPLRWRIWLDEEVYPSLIGYRCSAPVVCRAVVECVGPAVGSRQRISRDLPRADRICSPPVRQHGRGSCSNPPHPRPSDLSPRPTVSRLLFAHGLLGVALYRGDRRGRGGALF